MNNTDSAGAAPRPRRAAGFADEVEETEGPLTARHGIITPEIRAAFAAKQEAEQKSEAKPEPKSEPKPEADPKPEAKPEARPEAKVKPKAKPEPTPEPKPETAAPSPFSRAAQAAAEPTPAPAKPQPATFDDDSIYDDDDADLPPRKRSRAGLWVVLVVLIAALATIALVALRGWLNRPPAPPTAQEVAVKYLTAIADGHASAAQDQAAMRVDSATFTDASLAASKAIAPIADIKAESATDQEVVLSYTLGGKPVRGTFPMVHVAEGWKVKRPTVRVRLAPQPQMIVPYLDGQKLQSPNYTYDLELPPGAHKLSLPGGLLQFTSPDVTVTGLTQAPQVDGRTATVPDYSDKLRAKLDSSLKACTSAKDLAPKGCPWAFKAPSGVKVDPATVKYQIDGDPLANFNAPKLGNVDAIARGELRFTLHVTADGSRKNAVSDEKLVIAKYEADLASPDLPFIWNNN